MKRIIIGIVALVMALSSTGCSEAKLSSEVDNSRIENSKTSSDSEAVLDTSSEEETSRDNEPQLNNSKVIASGDCGENGDNVKWKLHEDGLLVIEGSGKMKDYPIDRGAIGGGWGNSEKNNVDTTPWRDYNEKIKSVVVSDGVIHLGQGSFSNTNIESLVLPNGLDSFNFFSLVNCETLKTIKLSKSIRNIVEDAPNEVDEYPILYGQRGLEYIDVDEDNEYFSSIDGVLYNKDQTELLCCPPQKREIKIPDSVKRIRSYAFSGCESLEKIDFPESVEDIGAHAFAGCIKFTTFDIPEKVKTINSHTFSNCTNLTDIVIPDGVTNIGMGAFDICKNLEFVTIPSSVTAIGMFAFEGCEKLKIKCTSGSYAEEYAKEHKIKYELIG